MTTASFSRGFGKWLVKNPWWRLLSFALAVFIWMNVATEPEMSTLINVPVQFKDPPDSLEVTSHASDSVQLETRGSSGQLRDLANSRPAVTLDFSGVRDPGERTFSITRAETNLPRGVEFIRATPAQVRFRFERSSRRMVPVKVRFLGRLREGLRLESYRVEPSSEQIAGPESAVKKMQEAWTDEIDLAAVDPHHLKYTVAAYLPNPQVRFISQPRVTVTMVLK